MLLCNHVFNMSICVKLFGHKKEGNIAICNNVDFEDFMLSKSEKHKICVSLVCEVKKPPNKQKPKLIVTENRLVLARWEGIGAWVKWMRGSKDPNFYL